MQKGSGWVGSLKVAETFDVLQVARIRVHVWARFHETYRTPKHRV